MNTHESNFELNDSILINSEIKDYLLESAKWTKFLSILGFIGLSLIVVFSILAVLAGSSIESIGFRSIWFALFYIISGVLYYFPINYLYQFSKGISQGIKSNDQESFTTALRSLKSHYKYMGIFTIVLLSFYLLVALAGILLIANK